MRTYIRKPIIEVFNKWWIPEPNTGCWLWIGSRYPNGYAKFHVNNKRELAHRISYQIHRGEIPKGLVLDHLCRTRSCVNPNHLETVTLRENLLRGKSPSAQQARRSHCIRGHPLSGDNLYEHDRHRYCKECRRNLQNELRNRRKESVPAI